MSVKDGDKHVLNIGNRVTFNVTVLISPQARQKGLSGNTGIPSGSGMLFIFDTLSYQSMWMPDMNFALDIVWLDETFTVVNINYNTPPCKSREKCVSYQSVYLVKYAIEMNAGDANKYKFSVGKTLQVEN